MLITAKYRHTDDAFIADKADEVLKSLEKYPSNIKHMAENGYLEPLLNHLLEGNHVLPRFNLFALLFLWKIMY